MGTDTTQQDDSPRHVRDIWRLALANEHSFQVGELAIGALLVTRRNYTINGKRVIIPGHISVVTNIGETPSFIHASPAAGKVEERPLRTLDTILGYVKVAL